MGAQAQASSLEEAQEKAKQLGLANHPTWLRLLHYERGSKESAVLTDSFFLSPDGRSDPDSELTATINAYFAPWGEAANEHPRCRFPARYYWLSQKLHLPGYDLRETHCENLEKWALSDSVKSVSLFLVSGYLGNPASTFGHALLKLNTDATDDPLGLFDLTLSYGALVPENEFVLRYVARGLFGGYQAGFSDKYFYTQDLVYSRTEFRDIWDYRLDLTDDERTLLILHIWEIVGKKFNYYFLDKNCAYRLAELIELAIEEDLVNNGRFWYLPVELFHRLNDIDTAWTKSHRRKLIQSIRYIPSSQRELYHQLKRLTPDELEVFDAIVRDGIRSMPAHLATLKTDRQILVLDGLLAYQHYRLIAEAPDASRERIEAKNKILLARLQLPPRPIPSVEIPELPSPAEGSRPMAFGVSIAGEENKEPFLLFNWSPMKQESVGQNSLEGDELVVFDLTIGLSEDERRVFFDKFDAIRVLNLNTLPVRVADESRLSWQLRIGADRIQEDGENRYDGVLRFGAGPAWKWHEAITGYGMVDVGAHTLSPVARVRPHLGLRLDGGVLRIWLYGGTESVDYDARFRDVWGGKMQCRLTDRSSVYIEVSKEETSQGSVGLNWYW